MCRSRIAGNAEESIALMADSGGMRKDGFRLTVQFEASVRLAEIRGQRAEVREERSEVRGNFKFKI